MLVISEKGCYVQSRRGKDLSGSFPVIAAAAADQMPPGTVDGELAVLGPDDVLDFAALPRRLAGVRRARALAAEQPASYVAFDLLWHPTLGDVDSADALAEYQAAKRLHKKEWSKTPAG